MDPKEAKRLAEDIMHIAMEHDLGSADGRILATRAIAYHLSFITGGDLIPAQTAEDIYAHIDDALAKSMKAAKHGTYSVLPMARTYEEMDAELAREMLKLTDTDAWFTYTETQGK